MAFSADAISSKTPIIVERATAIFISSFGNSSLRTLRIYTISIFAIKIIAQPLLGVLRYFDIILRSYMSRMPRANSCIKAHKQTLTARFIEGDIV